MKQNLINQILELKRIHALIKRCSTGTLDDFAEKFSVSPRTMSRTLTQMKEEFEAPIEYDALRHSYHYTEPYELDIRVNIQKGMVEKK